MRVHQRCPLGIVPLVFHEQLWRFGVDGVCGVGDELLAALVEGDVCGETAKGWFSNGVESLADWCLGLGGVGLAHLTETINYYYENRNHWSNSKATSNTPVCSHTSALVATTKLAI
jgi:hypothetical protein